MVGLHSNPTVMSAPASSSNFARIVRDLTRESPHGFTDADWKLVAATLREANDEDLTALGDAECMAILERGRGEALPLLARVPAARSNPDILRHILSARRPETLLAFLEHCTKTRVPAAFAALATRSPASAVELLEQGAPELLAALNAVDLTPLLQHTDRTIRQRALLALGRVRREPHDLALPPRKAASRTM